MSDLSIATAYQVGTDYQAECPTTHELFLSATVRKMALGARPVVWTLCPCCDAELHTGTACDPLSPQYHLFFDGGRMTERDALPLIWVRVKADSRIGWVDPKPLAGGMIRVVFEHDDGEFCAEELEEIWRS